MKKDICGHGYKLARAGIMEKADGSQEWIVTLDFESFQPPYADFTKSFIGSGKQWYEALEDGTILSRSVRQEIINELNSIVSERALELIQMESD